MGTYEEGYMKSKRSRRKLGAVALPAILLLSLVLAACGSGGSSDSTEAAASTESAETTESTDSTESTQSSEGEPTSAQEFSAYASEGGLSGAKTFLEEVQDESSLEFSSYMPSAPETEVPADKSVAIVICGSAAEGCVRGGEGAEAAAKALGWKPEVYDGQYNQNVESQAISSAISKGADAIILVSIPPVAVGGAVQEALNAEIPVITTFIPGSPQEMDGVFADVSNGTFEGGLALASWITVHSKGKARIVNNPDETSSLSVGRAAGVKAGLKEFCPECEILEEVQDDPAHFTTKAPVIASSAVQKYGTNNLYMVAPFDSAATFLVQGAKEANAPYFPIVSMDGNAEALKSIRNKEYIAADWAGAMEWTGWAAIDQVIRAFNGEEPSGEEGSSVVPSLLIDETNLPKKEGNWIPSFDYEKAYEELWGVE